MTKIPPPPSPPSPMGSDPGGDGGLPDFGNVNAPLASPPSRASSVGRGGRQSKATLFLVGSLVLATFTAVLVFQMMTGLKDRLVTAAEESRPIQLVAAARDLPMGVSLTEKHLELVDTLPGSIPTDASFESIDAVVGRTPKERVLAGEIIRTERLASAEAGVGLNAIITPGQRAMTIQTTNQAGVGGFLRPNNFVDVIVTIKPDESNTRARWVTETILQGIKVLAVGDSLQQKTKDEENRERSRRRSIVTLEVDLQEAEKLALSASQGELHLVLRSDVDVKTAETGGPMSTSRLVGLDKKRSTRKSGPTAVIIEGDSTVVEQFDSRGNTVNRTKRR